MARARKVQLVPPGPWDEAQLLAAARALVPGREPVRPGDAVGELVVVAVEPAPGAAMGDDTELEVLPTPPSGVGPEVDLVALIDVSESMGLPWDARRSRLEAAREAIASFRNAPGKGVATLAVFEFAKDARLVAGPAPPAEIALPATGAPKGRCHTATAVDAALAHIAARMTPGRAHAILLLADGVGDVGALQAAAARAARLHAPIHSIVFAPETDEVFEEIAAATGGSHQQASLPLVIEFEHQPGDA